MVSSFDIMASLINGIGLVVAAIIMFIVILVYQRHIHRHIQ